MRKRIICSILSLVLCFSLLCGCALIEHNDQEDARQVIVTIDNITETLNGKTYESGKREIRKSQLNSLMNNYGQAYMQNYGYTAEQVVDLFVDQLITRELLLIEAYRLKFHGFIEWTQADENDKVKAVYSSIDSRLVTITNEITNSFGEPSAPDEEEELSTETTYPTPDPLPEEAGEEQSEYYKYDEYGDIVMIDKKDEKGETVYEQSKDHKGNLLYTAATGETVYESLEYKGLDANGDPLYDTVYFNLSGVKVKAPGDVTPIMEAVKVPDYIVWAPDESSYPGLYGTEAEKSLQREAMRRFISDIKEMAEESLKFENDAEQKKWKPLFKEDDAAIDAVINSSKGIEGVYPMIGGTNYIDYLVGKSAEESVMLTKLQEYIVGTVDVSDDEVTAEYQNRLEYQRRTYTSDYSAYQTAATGDDTVLYTPDASYFYVKHILLPFSDEQTAYLTEYKNSPANAGKDYKVMRDSQMVNETVVYPHKHGENDMTQPKTVADVYNEIVSAMAPLASSPKLAERKFDELTYKYNTDPGAFGYGKSYAVQYGDDDGHSGYMEEFYYGAMELYDEYEEGSVLPKLVVTDYGVHIMYLARKTSTGKILGLDDYLTYGAYSLVRDTIAETIRSTKENNAFDSWSAERITYYQDNEKVVHIHEKKFENLYK